MSLGLASSSSQLVRTAIRAARRTASSSSRAATAASISHSTRRTLTTTLPRRRSDDPGGKPNDGSHSTVYDDFYNLLAPTDPNAEAALSIESIKSDSVTLSDGLVVTSPLVLVNGYCFLWDPPKLDSQKALPNGAGWEEWTRDEGIWKVLDVVEPKPEVLLFGTGASVLPPPPAIRNYLNSLGIQLEVQSSQNAASTYNVLSEEGRKVAIALVLSDEKAVARRSSGTSPSSSSSSSSSPSSQRAFSTSARSSSSLYSSSSSSSSTTSAPPLTLHHFLLRSSVYSLYRSYIRATQSIPNSSARYETIQFYRSGFQRALREVDLNKAKEALDYQKREFKRVAPGWELAGGSMGRQGGHKEIVAKYRGGASV